MSPFNPQHAATKRETGGESSTDAPLLSVILVTPDRLDAIRRTLAHLRAQTIAPRLELLIVAPASAGDALPAAEIQGLGSARLVRLDAIHSIAQANAAGVCAARAPIVAFVEEHSFPEPGWAAALLGAYADGCGAVGPVVRNANPAGLVGRADFLIAYGRWSVGTPGGSVDLLPGHNGSYRRDLLLAYGDALEAMLDAESVLHWDLRAHGWQLHLAPEAVVAHLNFERPRVWTAAQFHSGRVFAALRGQTWSLPRRLLYCAAAPLIPLLRLVRILGQAHRSGGQPLGLYPVLLWGLLAGAAGELLGYGFGAGDSVRQVGALEFHRLRHVSARTQALLEGPSS
ncbi:MAG: glycosyltransferase family 2 protein [Anaerolineae bacterium]